MSSTSEAKRSIALAAISNDNYSISSPDAWTRIRKFKAGDIEFSDFAAKNGTFVARVKEVNHSIESVLFISQAQLHEIHMEETSRPGRPWVDGGSNLDNQHAFEYAFGLASNQPDSNVQLLITPASYFLKHGELWSGSHVDQSLIPAWLNQVTNGIFKSDLSDINEIKTTLLELGFIETDTLSNHHTELVYEMEYAQHTGVPI